MQSIQTCLHDGGGGPMVITGFEEKCLNCPAPVSGTIQIEAERSHTAGDFDARHTVDQQSSGPDRVMRGISATGTCRACGASYSYKVFTITQLHLTEKGMRS